MDEDEGCSLELTEGADSGTEEVKKDMGGAEPMREEKEETMMEESGQVKKIEDGATTNNHQTNSVDEAAAAMAMNSSTKERMIRIFGKKWASVPGATGMGGFPSSAWTEPGSNGNNGSANDHPSNGVSANTDPGMGS